MNRGYEHLRDINNLIKEKKLDEATILLNKLPKEIVSSNKIIVKYLRGKITELNSRDEEDNIAFYYSKLYNYKGEYEKSLSIYYDMLVKTNKNIYNYYVGRSLYKMGYQLEALEYLNKYIKKGGFKLPNALLICTIILRNHKRYKTLNVYMKRCQVINFFNESNFELIEYDYKKNVNRLLYKKQED